jgi:hypothetical protein
MTLKGLLAMCRLPALLIAALLGWSAALLADQQPVPAPVLGVWAKDGRCTVPSDRLIITPTATTMGEGKPEAMKYAPEDGPGGRGALHWATEGVVSNLEYFADLAVIRFNGMGWGYPATAYYRRCAPAKAP